MPPAEPIIIDSNRLTPITGGPDRLRALIDLIDGAKRSLRLLYYIYSADRSGDRVRQALLRAMDRGVEVSLLIDGFGSGQTPETYFVDLSKRGSKFCRFNPAYGRRYVLRNHQKLALADGSKAIVGGFNISDDYFGTIAEGAWRDLGLQVEGPSVACLGGYFDALFGWAETEDASIRRLRRMLSRYSVEDGPLHWLFGGPTRRLSPWAKSVKADMMKATRLDMIVAYFAPSFSMLRRIFGVARRGKARVVTPAKLDHPFVVGAARFLYGPLLKRRVEIYEYQPTKLHSKLIVLDDVVHIGSANFDMRSLYLNLEMMLRIEDPAFAAMMRRFVEGEIASSKRILPEEHKKSMTLWNRIKWALGYFLVATADYNVSRRLNFGKKRFGG